MNINQALSYFPRRDNDDDEDKSDEKTERYTYQLLSILAVNRTYCTEIERKKLLLNISQALSFFPSGSRDNDDGEDYKK